MKLKVAGVKLAVGKDIAKNVQGICGAIKRAASEQADILLTPEGSLSGYTSVFDHKAAVLGLEKVTDAARERKLGLALGTCFVEDDGKCYNQIRFYQPDGEYLGFHSKILRCGTLTHPTEGEVTRFATTPLKTFQWNDRLTIGGLICNDMWANPVCTPMDDSHLSQRLAEMGTRIVFHAVNGGRSDSEISRVGWQYHESNLRMRARAGKLWIVTADNSEPVRLPSAAPSGVVDPEGNWACLSAPMGEEFFVHIIELE